jgi:hypothetical protein
MLRGRLTNVRAIAARNSGDHDKQLAILLEGVQLGVVTPYTCERAASFVGACGRPPAGGRHLRSLVPPQPERAQGTATGLAYCLEDLHDRAARLNLVDGVASALPRRQEHWRWLVRRGTQIRISTSPVP